MKKTWRCKKKDPFGFTLRLHFIVYFSVTTETLLGQSTQLALVGLYFITPKKQPHTIRCGAVFFIAIKKIQGKQLGYFRASSGIFYQTHRPSWVCYNSRH